MSINLEFLKDERFVNSYNAGLTTLELLPATMRHRFVYDYWRVYLACTIASHASRKEGDFVECGVNTGFLMKSIISYVDFSSLGKKFHLFDTWQGVPLDQLSELERDSGKASVNLGYYDFDFFSKFLDSTKNFPFINVTRGRVPEALDEVVINEIAFLSIDMNCAYPEVEAIKYYWERIVQGGVVLLDDYGFDGYQNQKSSIDSLGETLGFSVLHLPSGQGLIVK